LPSPKANRSQDSPCPTADLILGQYLTFLKTTQGLADATLVLRRLHVKPFLLSLETTGVLTDLRGLAPSAIHDYIIVTSKPLTRASRKHLVSGLRSFLRFAHANGLIERPLVDAVPVILTRKLDRLPQTIPWEDVQKLLTMPKSGDADRET
jgi:integrase/recombinase XerD